MNQRERSFGKDARLWPEGGLESVESCPVCGSKGRTLLYEGLEDRIFFCAPGTWNFYRCANCRSGYLDPRPTPETIGLAYQEYFTHSGENRPSARQVDRGWRKLRHALANGYVNQRYGTALSPSIAFGAWLAPLVPSLKRGKDLRFRFLPRPRPGMRVLDVGCGNGAFLAAARQAGWQVYGVEPDPKAAAKARDMGVEVRSGTIEAYGEIRDYFDAVTLSHVVEHVHDPLQVLLTIRRLAKPGGMLYIDTPNLDSWGHRRFGQFWLGLDPPRHLVLFTVGSLLDLLKRAGFREPRLIRRPEVALESFQSSTLIQRGLDPYRGPKPKATGSAHLARCLGTLAPTRLEFITLTAKA